MRNPFRSFRPEQATDEKALMEVLVRIAEAVERMADYVDPHPPEGDPNQAGFFSATDEELSDQEWLEQQASALGVALQAGYDPNELREYIHQRLNMLPPTPPIKTSN